MGVGVVNWKAITGFDISPNGRTTAEGALRGQINYSVTQMQNTTRMISLMNQVSFAAQRGGRPMETNMRARRIAELLYQLKMAEERWVLSASALLMVPPMPVLTASTTGGTLAAGTYWVKVTAKNAQGETTSSAARSVATIGITSSLAITIFTVPYAAQYNVYIGIGATQPADSAMWLQGGLSGTHAPQPAIDASMLLDDRVTTTPTGAVMPGALTVTLSVAPATSGTALASVTQNTAKTFVDEAGNPLMWDGVIAQALNNASQANRSARGAQVAQPAAANGLLALSDIDNLLAAMYVQAAGDPDHIIINPWDSVHLTDLMVGSGQLRYVVETGYSADLGQLTTKYRTTRYLNKSTGKEISIIIDRYCPQGHIVFLPLSTPFPVPDGSSAVEIETNQEYCGEDFALADSNCKFAAHVEETLKVYYLGGLGVLRGLSPSF
jgi:hypothetical protein